MTFIILGLLVLFRLGTSTPPLITAANRVGFVESSMCFYPNNAVDITTSGWWDAKKTMTEASKTIWTLIKSNFTQFHLDKGQSIIQKNKQRHLSFGLLNRVDFSAKYLIREGFWWSGPENISAQCRCRINEECTIEVTYTNKNWVSKCMASRISDIDEKAIFYMKKSVNYKKILVAHQQIMYTHTFIGPNIRDLWINYLWWAKQYVRPSKHKYRYLYPSHKTNPI